MLFFVGLHRPAHAPRFARCMISANVLRDRRSDIAPNDWILDSGAFTELTRHGGCFREDPEEYAERAARWSRCGNLLAAVTQDFMCEPFVLETTGGTVEDHQGLTLERYRALHAHLRRMAPDLHLMPVLQGWRPADYARHVKDYGRLLPPASWVGAGSVCKRNGRPAEVEAVLGAILEERPDLRLHGFGLKLTDLSSGLVRACLHSADSMAWSFAASRAGRDPNDPRGAEAHLRRVETAPVQLPLLRQARTVGAEPNAGRMGEWR